MVWCVFFFMFGEYREGEKTQREIKDSKIRANVGGKRKKLSHNVVVFTVLHQAEEGLLNTERSG